MSALGERRDVADWLETSKLRITQLMQVMRLMQTRLVLYELIELEKKRLRGFTDFIAFNVFWLHPVLEIVTDMPLVSTFVIVVLFR